MNVLVVAAHPDDEVLGCGGTIARLTEARHDVSILILGEGMTSRGTSGSQEDKDTLERLHVHARAAAAILGVKNVTLAKLPDNRFDTVALLDIVKIVEESIKRVAPEEIYTQNGGDLNIDHERTFRAVLTATRPMEGAAVKRVFAYEVGSSTEWSFQQFAPAFHPNTFVDITRTLEKKIEAMRTYASEIRPFPHPRSVEALRAVAQRWGSVAGCRAAEAFQLIRSVP
ncbi:hypothetical protein A3E47_01330 [Candidatus Peribacteria bacterium RIFCSPHIGHO2_12_FULL_54_10]|nr:MAG: hypothetical protein A3E47_01330 [Candidatus Peribacteria bacterium RIFCSPHIGHO2_12_FULL_54_10]